MKAGEAPFITIVMAVYNGEDFLSRSLESIVNQDFDDWELICVNDGLSDSSLSILNTYAQNDRRIRVISQENSGPNRARMAGYKLSQGQYTFCGIDQDDFVERSFIRKLSKVARDTNADVVLCDRMIEMSTGNFESFTSRGGFNALDNFTGQHAFMLTFPWEIHGHGLWRDKLVNIFAVDDSNSFNSYDADEYLSRLMLLEAQKVVISDAKYFYCNNANSITSKRSLKKLQSLNTNERLLELAESKDLKDSVKWRILEYQGNCIRKRIKMIRKMKNHDELSESQYRSALFEITDYFHKFKRNIRKIATMHMSKKFGAEMIILKLTFLISFAKAYTMSPK